MGEENSTTGIDLQGMKSNPNINFALGRDIDAGLTQTWREGNFTNEIMEINATYYRGFQSFSKSNDFEGLGHKIHNNLNGSLFNNFSNGKISNVLLEVLDNNKYSFDYGGGMLANSISNARVVNVHIEGNLTSAKGTGEGTGAGVTFEYTSNMGGLIWNK